MTLVLVTGDKHTEADKMLEDIKEETEKDKQHATKDNQENTNKTRKACFGLLGDFFELVDTAYDIATDSDYGSDYGCVTSAIIFLHGLGRGGEVSTSGAEAS